MKRIGLLTSGGDCQALNAAMRGVVKGLSENVDELEVYGFHNGYKERKQHPDLADYASMPQEEAILRMQNEILYLHQELDFIKKIIELDRKGEQRP